MNKINLYTGVLLLLIVSISCSNEDQVFDEIDIEDGNIAFPDWTAQTHSKDGDLNYDLIFPNTKVNRLDITIDTDSWAAMQSDLSTNVGSQRGAPGEFDFDPIWVPCDVFFNDTQWYKVGIRYKGNSSLRSSYQQGIKKLPFKLDFDEFEDDYPQLDNQRFYGFKQLSLKNNYDDPSCLREKVASEVFANAGLASAHTAFYTLYVDHGDGPIYFGLYTMVEEVDDTVLDTQFSDNDGNLYKPDGVAASFANGSFDEDGYVKKTNEDEADFSDVQGLLTVLHDGTRTTDAATWRASLESVFDTDVFLNYLAANTVIQNWDTYGRMTHNYYLYNNPDNNLLTWIPWDNNEALQEGKQGGALAINFSDVQSGQWPLIEYMYDDEVYRAKYDALVKETIDGPFEVSTMQAVYENYAALIEPHVTSENQGYTFLKNSSPFQQAIAELKQHVSNRSTVVDDYLK